VKNIVSYGFAMLLIGVVMLFAGCETTLELPNNNLPKLTIISHLSTAASGWEKPRVYVFVSQSPSDSSSFEMPENLEVEVTELETDLSIRLSQTTSNGETFFGFPKNFLKEGFSYTISAYAPGFESVRATTSIPTPSTISNLNISSVRIEPSTKNEFKDIVRYALDFEINHVGKNRYYHLVFYNQYAGLPSAYIVNPELTDDQPFLAHYDFGVLIDREDLVPGAPLTFNFVDWVLEDNELRRVFVELRTITEEYYKYHSSLARQLIVRQDPFAEPVTIFNNIEGGYGNFSGFSPDVSSSYLPL
jgi:hypothetical protein